MKKELPNSYNWFEKLSLTRFIPWVFEKEIDQDSQINERFKIESKEGREVIYFGQRQDMDTFAGFEVVNDKIKENVIVFHLSFQKNVKGWNIIESEHLDFFNFMEKRVLPEMKEWIKDDAVEDYL